MGEEEFRATVRQTAGKFKSLVQDNKVMLFSATYCSYCTVAKVFPFCLKCIQLSLHVTSRGERVTILVW